MQGKYFTPSLTATMTIFQFWSDCFGVAGLTEQCLHDASELRASASIHREFIIDLLEALF